MTFFHDSPQKPNVRDLEQRKLPGQLFTRSQDLALLRYELHRAGMDVETKADALVEVEAATRLDMAESGQNKPEISLASGTAEQQENHDVLQRLHLEILCQLLIPQVLWSDYRRDVNPALLYMLKTTQIDLSGDVISPVSCPVPDVACRDGPGAIYCSWEMWTCLYGSRNTA